MANKKSNNSNARARNPKPKKKTTKQPMGSARPLAPYLRMLADPCGAAIVRAPYLGMDTGYLIRTRTTFAPNGGTGIGAKNSYFLQYTPAGAAANGFTQLRTGDAAYVLRASDDFLTSGVVSKARPIASCLKWVPTGPVTSRQGVVGVAYSTGALVVVGGTSSTFADLLNSCNALASNGSTPHEVKWLPTDADQLFTNPKASVATEVSGGTMAICLVDVDSTAGAPNGYFEATTIYEWVPAVGQGGAPSVAQANPYTLNQALAQVRDVGQFLFGDSSRAVGDAMRGAATSMVTTMLTGATYMAGRRGGMMSL